MLKFLVIEIQTAADGSVANLVTAYSTEGEAEDGYLAARSSARQSSVPIHTIIWLDNRGNQKEKKVYIHPVVEQTTEE